ncbi:MAG: beta-N-acetylhexosaminidase [Chlamydiota bacterium]
MNRSIHGLLALVFCIYQSCDATSSLLSKMSTEEKVGQLLMVHFHGEDVNDDAKVLIHQAHVGGFIYFNWSNGLHNPKQVQKLSTNLQKQVQKTDNPIPLIIAVDQEGGVVSRLKKGFTVFPGNGAIAKTGIPGLAYQCASATAVELKAVGVNMTLGPVVDVNVNPYNPVIGVRSFSNHPEKVVTFAREALRGFQKEQLISVLKHFPGHGDVTLDSHVDLPMVDKTIDELKETELYPFREMCEEADAIMTAHLLVPALDPFNCATLSKRVTQKILRDEYGFEGVIMSDSLVMKGFLTNCPNIGEAAIRAFEAGCDMLILGGKQLLIEDGFELNCEDTLTIYNYLLEAVYEGRIPEQRLNDSVERILRLKDKYRLIDQVNEEKDLTAHVNTPYHKKIAREVAYRALRNQEDSTQKPPNFGEIRVAVFAPELIQYDLNLTTLATIGKETRTMFFEELNPSLDEALKANSLIKWADAFIVCSYNAWKNDQQAQFIQKLTDSKKPITVIALRDPQDSDYVRHTANFIISTSSPDAYSIQSAVDILTGVTNVP